MLLGLCIRVGVVVLDAHVAGTAAGGLVAVAFVAWWFHPRRSARSTRWVAVAAGVAGIAFLGLVYARYVDCPARPQALPRALSEALGAPAPASRAVVFHRYDLGGFIDREWLWRIDAAPDLVALAVRGLGLRPAAAVPPRFWRMPPHYWPRALPAGGEAFASPAFPPRGRGPDGDHYFLVHDPAPRRAFVWLTANF